MNSKKSFTIVELLVVMAVIGVLLALSVFGIQAIQKSQRETQRITDLKNIQGQLQAYYSKYNRYPLETELIIGYSTSSMLVNPRLSFNHSLISLINAISRVPLAQGEGNLSVLIHNGNIQFSGIPLTSLTPTIINTVFNDETCTGDNFATPDTWIIDYHVASVPSPQEYALYACTENGKSYNLGSKND